MLKHYKVDISTYDQCEFVVTLDAQNEVVAKAYALEAVLAERKTDGYLDIDSVYDNMVSGGCGELEGADERLFEDMIASVKLIDVTQTYAPPVDEQLPAVEVIGCKEVE